jgi:hypothetical protein
MADMPEGAQLSEDGHYWWDGYEWHAVSAEVDGGGGGGDAGAAAFSFDPNGLRIDAENSPVPSANEALKATFTVINVGTAAGTCHVTIYVDGQDTGVTWDSGPLRPGDAQSPDGDGYVRGIAAQTEGRHKFEAYTDPPGPGDSGKASYEIDVRSAE